MKPITTILVVNNEEKLIRRCLESVKLISSEIIVIHDGKCVDNSLKIASEFTKKVFERNKYYCLEPHLVDALYMANHDWIMRLDTDEYLSPELIEHILKLDLENLPYTYFTANWREHMVEQSEYSRKVLLFNRNHSLNIGIPHRAVEVSGDGLLLDGYLEHTPVHANFGFRDMLFKKLKPFARVDARMRYAKPIKIYSLEEHNKLPRKITFRNKYPLLTAPFFALRVYFNTLKELAKSRNRHAFKRVFNVAHAHLIEQFILSYYMYKEKKKTEERKATEINEEEIDRHYDEEYFERGLNSGKSLYMNYRWMPELSIRMAYFMTKDLPIKEGSKILDFGCAKGYLVRAFRFLNFETYGIDLSNYAVSQAERDVIKYCKLIKHPSDLRKIFDFKFDWVISKDVFEHIPENDLAEVLKQLSLMTQKMFVVVPLGKDDTSGKFIIPDYNNEISHITIKTDKWWKEFFKKNNFTVEKASFKFRFCKENWTSKYSKSNGFYVLKSRRR
ncbi:glycosyltransferase [Candidatus Wolfebacteria bacterium]|nr:glycosyltransferase [Candidatus Wolfebacteria bacterium]